MIGTREERIAELENLFPAWESMSVWERFASAETQYPDREFLVFEDGLRYTYAQAKREASHLAACLAACGVRQGSHVAVGLSNSPELALLYLAIAKLGAVAICVNMRISTYELSIVLDESDAEMLICGKPVDFVSCKKPAALHSIVSRSAVDVSDGLNRSWEDVFGEGAQDAHDACVCPEAYDPDAISSIIFTSGSTGRPKGVPLTSDALLRSAYSNCLNRGFEQGRRIYTPLPFAHSYAYVEGFLSVLFVGGALLIASHKLSAADAIDFMKRERANDMLTVPSMMMSFIQYLDEYPIDLPDVHAVYCSASSCPAWVWPGIKRVFKVEDIITGYGMTEVSGASMQTVPGDGEDILTSRVGRILPAGCAGLPEYGGALVQYGVFDPETGEECPSGVSGELWCRGATLTKGYYRNDAANAEHHASGGWFKTGDTGFFDEAGYLVLSGRMGECYKINGENVSPLFVEELINRCELVRNVEVVGIPDEKFGTVGAAFVQLNADSGKCRQELEDYCKENLARFQQPKYYFFMGQDDWPLTQTGKIQKSGLKRLARELLGAGEISV